MPLTPINNGDLADATVVYGNFQYLDGRINATNTALAATQSNVQSTINTTLSVYQDVDKRDDQSTKPTSGEVPLTADSILAITPTGNITFTTPTVTDGKYHQMLVQLNLDELYTVNVGTTHYFNSVAPVFATTGHYNIIYEYDNTDNYWYCCNIIKGVVS